jgi:hypothetical protein
MRFRFDGHDEPPPPHSEPIVEHRSSTILDHRQRIEFLRLVHKGMGRRGACARLGIEYGALRHALAHCPGFRKAVRHVDEIRAENLFSVLYAAALGGDIRAARFLLARQDRFRERRDEAGLDEPL